MFAIPAVNETYEILIPSISLRFCVHKAFEVTSESSANGRHRSRFYLFTSHFAPDKAWSRDADILNNTYWSVLESKMARHVRQQGKLRPASYCLEGSRRGEDAVGLLCVYCPLIDGRMGPGNRAKFIGE